MHNLSKLYSAFNPKIAAMSSQIWPAEQVHIDNINLNLYHNNQIVTKSQLDTQNILLHNIEPKPDYGQKIGRAHV